MVKKRLNAPGHAINYPADKYQNDTKYQEVLNGGYVVALLLMWRDKFLQLFVLDRMPNDLDNFFP